MPKTVLIADESITIRSVAESLLRGESLSVHSAADGHMALEIARAERPDLALIGERLAGLGGAELCKTLKSDPDLRSLPIILMRADGSGAACEYADAVLSKPFSPQSLLDAVHRFIDTEISQEGTAPVSVAGPADPRLEDELIDHALGLDEVGSAPGEVLDVAAGRGHAGLGSPGREETESALPLGLVDEVVRESAVGGLEDLEDLHVSRTPDESFGLSMPTERLETVSGAPSGMDRMGMDSTDRREPDFDIDLAIDAAFNAAPEAAASREDTVEPTHGVSRSSLREVTLGEQNAPSGPPDRLTTSSAAPGGGLDLAGPDDVVEDRPHDYDWFIKEIQQDGHAPSEQPRRPEPPRIEPFQPRPAAPAGKMASEPSVKRPESEAGEKGAPAPRAQSRRAYDEFITEFRAEIARIEGVAAPAAGARPESREETARAQIGKRAFEETGERTLAEPVAPAPLDASIQAWGDELIQAVTSQVARELAAKIDSKEIYSLIEKKLKEARKHRA